MKIYIVTNYGGGENYTPSVFLDRNKAKEWVRKCTANNVFDMYGDSLAEIGFERKDYECVLNFVNEDNYFNVEVYDNICTPSNCIMETYVGDSDDGGNVIQLFEIKI